MTIGERLNARARESPESIAFVEGRNGRTWSFAELDAAVARAAGWWQAQGLQPGNAVLVFVPMSVELYVTMLALFRIGAVALFLDPSAGVEHIERCCKRWPPDALLAIPKAHLLRLKSKALRQIRLKVSLQSWLPGARWWHGQASGTSAAQSRAAPTDPALVTFTSGSTGEPKAAVRTHAFLLAQYEALAPNIQLQAGEVDFATLPVFVLANLAAGVTTLISSADLRRPGHVDATHIFREIERFGVNRVSASPAFFECLIAHGRSAGRILPALKKIYTGGAPVFPRTLTALQELAPQAEVVAVYGSTEAEPIGHVSAPEISPEELTAMKTGAGLLAGKTVPEIRLAILDDQWGQPRADYTDERFSSLVLGPGQVGEIVVAGDHVLPGYLSGIGDQETKFRVSGQVWHRTGDAGSIDSAGRLWLHGRCAARIDDSRGRLYPFGVECAAMSFPQVRRAAVLAHGGERLLFVEGRVSEADQARISDTVSWAQIDRLQVMAQLPVDRRHNAKIDYPALRKLLIV